VNVTNAPSSRAAVLSDPLTWPLRPLLPLSRDVEGNWPELGFLVAAGGPVVYRGSIYDIPPGLDLSRFKSTEYETLDAVLADGWKVD
jgi:hypothetical protein